MVVMEMEVEGLQLVVKVVVRLFVRLLVCDC